MAQQTAALLRLQSRCHASMACPRGHQYLEEADKQRTADLRANSSPLKCSSQQQAKVALIAHLLQDQHGLAQADGKPLALNGQQGQARGRLPASRNRREPSPQPAKGQRLPEPSEVLAKPLEAQQEGTSQRPRKTEPEKVPAGAKKGPSRDLASEKPGKSQLPQQRAQQSQEGTSVTAQADSEERKRKETQLQTSLEEGKRAKKRESRGTQKARQLWALVAPQR